MKYYLATWFLSIASFIHSQPAAITFQEARPAGLVKTLDSLYMPAVHVDSTQAVFQSKAEQELVYSKYNAFLQEMGIFLQSQNFKWNKPTPCFNRVYFNPDGGIDYYIYHFRGKPEDLPSKEQQEEFHQILNMFIQDYKLGIKSTRRFSQCSPVTFMPE